MQKKFDYLEKLRKNLADERNRTILIRMLQARTSVKEYLNDKDLTNVMLGKRSFLRIIYYFN